MKAPNAQHDTVRVNATTVIDLTAAREYGKRGSRRKGGVGIENWTRDRKKRLKVIGSQNAGTTYQAVLVNTSRYEGPKRRAVSRKCRG